MQFKEFNEGRLGGCGFFDNLLMLVILWKLETILFYKINAIMDEINNRRIKSPGF